MRNYSRTWKVEDKIIDVKFNLIKDQNREYLVKPRLMKLMNFFLLHPSTIVEKDKIIDYMWEDRIVTENLLTKSISELRNLLYELFQTDLEIETIRSVGYRFKVHTELNPISDVPPTSQIHFKFL